VDDIANSSILTKFLSSDMQKDREPEGKKRIDLPEDVEVTSISIPATRQMSDHVLYQIDVTNARKDAPFDKWTVLKRFGQFYDMDCAVRAAFLDKPDILAKFPEPPERKAKLFNDHMDNTFVEHRRVLLQNYISNMLGVLEIVRNKDFLVFFGCGRLMHLIKHYNNLFPKFTNGLYLLFITGLSGLVVFVLQSYF